MADGDGHLLVGDQVFKLQFGRLVDDFGATLVAVLFANLFKLGDDYLAQSFVAAQNLFVLGDLLEDLVEFVENLVDRELSEAIELQLEDGVDLTQREAGFFMRQTLAVELDDNVFALAPGVEVFAGVGAGVRSANDADDRVEVVEGDLEPFQNVLALAGLAQQKDGAALHHIGAVIDEDVDGVGQTQLAWLAVDHGQKDHREALLQLRVLVELVEDDFRLRAALEADDHAHAVAVALVARALGADVDLGDDLVLDQLGDALEERGLVDLVGQLGDDQGLEFLGDAFDGDAGAHEEAAAAGAIGLGDAAAAIKNGAGRKVRSMHVLEHLFEAGLGIFNQRDGRVDDLGEVVRRNVGGHADGDAVGAVDDQYGNARGQHGGLVGGLVEVGNHVDGFHLDVGHQGFGDALQAAFGVTVGRGRVAIDRTEVALPVDQRIAQRPILGHAD